jgi:hypothetical protein
MNKEVSANRQFVVCIRNDEFEVALSLHTIYPVLPDESAERIGWIRIVDNSGEDYLYPGDFFQAIEVSRSLGEQLLRRRDTGL